MKRQDKIRAEAEGKIRLERENRDLHLEELRVKAAEARDTTLQSIRAAGTCSQTFIALAGLRRLRGR